MQPNDWKGGVFIAVSSLYRRRRDLSSSLMAFTNNKTNIKVSRRRVVCSASTSNTVGVSYFFFLFNSIKELAKILFYIILRRLCLYKNL